MLIIIKKCLFLNISSMHAKRYMMLFKFTILMMFVDYWYAWIITCMVCYGNSLQLILMAILGHSSKHRCSFV